MQAAKDTFYVMLRDGVVAVNPQRVTVIRGVQRPAVLVEENELVAAAAMPDVFRMRWSEALVDRSGTVPVVKLRCAVEYETAGSATTGDTPSAGLDRGRLLTAMDGELLGVLDGAVQSTAKMDFSTGLPVPTGTRIFWGDVVFGPESVREERVGRTVLVNVWSYEESGDQ